MLMVMGSLDRYILTISGISYDSWYSHISHISIHHKYIVLGDLIIDTYCFARITFNGARLRLWFHTSSQMSIIYTYMLILDCSSCVYFVYTTQVCIFWWFDRPIRCVWYRSCMHWWHSWSLSCRHRWTDPGVFMCWKLAYSPGGVK